MRCSLAHAPSAGVLLLSQVVVKMDKTVLDRQMSQSEAWTARRLSRRSLI